ncbi:TetR/AcrR family transcriptional regulator [Janibacter alittae]|uniref:TetR/AcrR family transcriptional regulator n=1 Tax=Janibacter alittae TaxID=3115209 RepID=A0ABZ2MHK7_9MICO
MTVRANGTVDAKERILTVALALFGERGVAATSLREVARVAGVAPGLVVHHFGGKEGLHGCVDDHVVALFRQALDSAPLTGSTAEVAAARDEAITRMFEAHPEAIDYLRRVVVTPDPGDVGLARKLIAETIVQTRMLREHGIARSRAPVEEQAVAVLVGQLGHRLLQPTLSRLWTIAGADSAVPTVTVTLHGRRE